MVAPASVHGSSSIAAPRGSAAAVTIFRLAGFFAFLTATMGAVVAATQSAAACPTWPGCRPGDLAPPLEAHPVIEFTHRVVAMMAGVLIVAAGLTASRLQRRDRWVRILPWISLGGALVAAVVGRRVVLQGGVPAHVGALDLFCALVAMTAMGVAAVLASRPPAGSEVHGRGGPVGTIAAITLAVLVCMHVTGVLVAGPGSYTSSMGWPLWRIIASDLHPWLQVTRLVMAGLGAALVVATAVAITRAGWRWAGLSLALALTVELALGAVIRSAGLHQGTAAAHSALAMVLVSGLGLMAAAARVSSTRQHIEG